MIAKIPKEYRLLPHNGHLKECFTESTAHGACNYMTLIKEYVFVVHGGTLGSIYLS